MNRNTPISSQQKIEAVADRLGLSGLKKQQGTTRVIYDSLPLDGRRNFRFFEGSGTRVAPLTNLGSFGNKLDVGETLVVQKVCFNIFTFEGGVITSIAPLSLVAPYAPISKGDWNFSIGNVQVVKPLPVLVSNPAFSKSDNPSSNIFDMDTDIVIPPLLEFVSELITPSAVTIVGAYIQMTISGVGAIVNTRQTF